MALSRETLISMIKNEYPSSYSSHVEKMSHEDLMGLLDYLDSIKGKADGGAIGIEVLFGPKRKDFASGGWHPGAGRDKKGYQKTHPQHSDGPPSITNPYIPPVVKKPPVVQVSDSDVHPMYQNWIHPAAAVKTDFLKKHGWYSKPFFKPNPTTSAFLGTDTATQNQTLYDELPTLTMEQVLDNMAGGKYDTFPTDVQENLKEQVLGKVDFGDTFQKNWSTDVVGPTIKDGKIDIDETKLEVDEMPVKPKDVLEVKDGGRVGFQTGGWADNLEGEAKGIYDSMTAYGASDAEIQAKLQAQNLWSPDGGGGGGGGTDQVTGIINQNIGGDGPYPGQVVDQTSFADYQFNKSDYAPGGKLEVNPAALGMSFFEQPGSGKVKDQLPASFVEANKHLTPNQQKDKYYTGKEVGVDYGPLEAKEPGFIESFMSAAVPNKMTSEFRTPTGIIPKGPQDLGFMTKDIFGKPYGSANTLTRDQLREMYDNYSKFWGRGSNYQMAKVPGSAENLIKLIPGFGTVKTIGEGIFGPGGDRSMQSKYTVDNAGWGNTGMKDEFGVNTFSTGDSIFRRKDAPTRDYLDRMQDKMDENIDFFGGTRWGFGGKELDKKGSSVENFAERWENFDDLDAADQQALINEMKAINGFKTKQMLAYRNRIATEKINKEWKQKEAEIAEAEKQKENLANATALQKKTMAARGEEGGSGGTFVDRKTGAMKGYEKGAGGGKDAPSQHFYIKDGGIAQHAPQRKGIASMFTRRR